MYSMPRDLSTSTMKSEPGRSLVRTSTLGGVPVSAARTTALGAAASGAATRGDVTGCGCWACARLALAARLAAPAVAVPRNQRRFNALFLDLAMTLAA